MNKIFMRNFLLFLDKISVPSARCKSDLHYSARIMRQRKERYPELLPESSQSKLSAIFGIFAAGSDIFNQCNHNEWFIWKFDEFEEESISLNSIKLFRNYNFLDLTINYTSVTCQLIARLNKKLCLKQFYSQIG